MHNDFINRSGDFLDQEDRNNIQWKKHNLGLWKDALSILNNSVETDELLDKDIDQHIKESAKALKLATEKLKQAMKTKIKKALSIHSEVIPLAEKCLTHLQKQDLSDKTGQAFKELKTFSVPFFGRSAWAMSAVSEGEEFALANLWRAIRESEEEPSLKVEERIKLLEEYLKTAKRLIKFLN